MKKILTHILVAILLISNLFVCTLPVFAAKAETNRSIAIVFDNSGSMYVSGEKAWCRATYAMEVFASMLNKGDTLAIHPMNPIEVNGQKYTMDSPFLISDPSQASQIRQIYTADADGTPIEAIDAAIKGLSASQTNANYLIVLTDGKAFYENGTELTVSNTKQKLAERFNNCIGPNLNVLYLGIGSSVAMPEMNSEYYTGEKASDSSNVLSSLTMMCNKIFARDTLPSAHISGKTIDFDISLSKLIVFVQGENVSDVKVTGKSGAIATPVGSTKTQYSSIGAGNYNKAGQSPVDTSLQGMLVTYADCSAGSYDISYSGKASNVEVYYEPDADLDFVFTDEEGNAVDPTKLYNGDYKVQFGLKDAKTGELITSDLIGDPVYQGKYIVNGNEFPIVYSGKRGEVPVSLEVGDTFGAELTASYLSGYSITKTSRDFGWPDGILKVAAKKLRLDIVLTISQKHIQISKLDKGKSIIATIKSKRGKLTAEDFSALDFKVETEGLGYTVTSIPEDFAYEIKLNSTGKTEPGKYKITTMVTQKNDMGEDFVTKESAKLRLSKVPLWLYWIIILLIILILIVIIYLISHLKKMPTNLHASAKPGQREMNVGGADETMATIIKAGLTDNVLKVETNFAGQNNGVRMEVEPGTDCILAKKAVKKKIKVKAASIKPFGAATIYDVNVGNRQYVLNNETNRLEPAIADARDFELAHNSTVTYSGTMLRNGVEEPFYATVKLNFNKR